MDSSTPEDLDESTSSSDAADVLIRSTALPFRGQAISENGSVRCISIKPGYDGGVNISVKRLCESALPSMQVTTKTALEQEPAYVPPALPANKPQASSSEVRKAPPSNKAKEHSGDREVKHGSEEDAICKASSARVNKSLSRNEPQGGSMLKGQDVLISQYSGNKEAIRAVLKQRSASAPLMREVKVQLLNRPASATHSHQGPQASLQPTEPQLVGPSTGDQGASAAALTAAALTVTAPLLKAQSELDSRLARFSEDLQRLQAGYGQVLRPPNDRSSALEQQLDTLTQQRLQHLERIQQQQLELQNRLLGSALDAVRARAPGPVGQASAVPDLRVTSAPYTQSTESPSALAPHTAEAKPGAGDLGQQQGRGKRSPQATPSPRRFAPKPMSRNARARNAKERLVADGWRAPRAAGGSGRLLEDILNSSKSPESTAQTAGGKKVTIATAVCQPEPSSGLAVGGASVLQVSAMCGISDSDHMEGEVDIKRQNHEQHEYTGDVPRPLHSENCLGRAPKHGGNLKD
ncbi:hypothetical protein GJAV_G00021880 [Gymnothorax javanicus]|nr:hypothetical protein GJAV_G00021880 [Gymnothorax javanicus]